MVYSSTARSVSLPVWLLLALGVAGAQVYPPGGYPPGGYPPGGYPGGGYPYPGGGTGIPIPGGRRSSKGTPKADPNQPYPNFRGKLKHMDEKTISLELGDDRVMDFRRTSKTKFFKNGNEIKTPDFQPGDQISVEGPEEANGDLTAVNVYWEKAAAATQTSDAAQAPKHSPEKDKSAGVPDTWAKEAPKDAPKPPADAPGAAAKPEASAEVERPAAKDPEDPGRPVLRRGKPADPARERSAPVPEQADTQGAPAVANTPAQPVETASAASPGAPPVRPAMRRNPDDDDTPIARRPMDDLIRKATDAALDFTETLPSYVCQERMARFQSDTHPARFEPQDLLTLNVVYENGKESYRDLHINGKPTNKTIEESGGAWSTGEFGTVLIDLFHPATAAEFHYQRESRAGGIMAKLYDFNVTHDHSHWDVKIGGQSYSPAYRGSVWIDPQTGRVLRIEKEAYGFPSAFPVDHAESATDYQYVRLGDARQYLLPVHAENLMCERGTNNCSKIVIDFANYHKYAGESTITFGPAK